MNTTWRSHGFSAALLAAVCGGGFLGCYERKDVSQPAPSKETRETPAGDLGEQESHPAPPVPKQAGKATSTEKAAADDLKPPPLFDGWSRPVLAFFVTGQQLGYIEPCGCTGLENQLGGLARRFTLLEQLREEKGWEVVPLDVGNQVRRYGPQPVIKFQRTSEALRSMEYRAVAFGPDDLLLPATELLSSISPPEGGSIFTSANVEIISRDLTPAWQVFQAGGKKIGVVAILGDSLRQKLQGDEVTFTPAADALKAALEKVREAGCDFYVLLAHASLDESRELARQVDALDLVITGGGIGEPTLEMERVKGSKAQMAQVGTKGMYVGVIGLFDDAIAPLRYQRLPLDSSYKDAPEMLKLLADYQEELRRIGLEGAGAREQPHPSGYKFVGTEKCGECHLKALAVWENTPHAHATDSLVTPPNNRGHIARHYDPECLSCHVTGWEPQKFFPFTSGYLDLEKTAHLKHNGCENCHGPGSTHVAAEEGEGDDDKRLMLRESMRLPLAGDKAKLKCLECHDLDNDPHFKFEEYWPQVEHVGKD
ncbi:MAG TPA: multiheme c-type cytochrome [Pirellulaceae bacterium]|nr:multiheme c-type cytochrome [Pirellulaceae bacterium]